MIPSIDETNIQQLENHLMILLEKNSYIKPELYKEYNIKRGLRNANGTGVLVGITRIANVEGYEIQDGHIEPIDGRLLYRGIPLTELVKGFQDDNRFGFDETVYLLLLGELPSQSRLDNFIEMTEHYRTFPKYFNEDMIYKSVSKNIMNMMQRTVLSLYNYDEDPENLDLLHTLRQSISLIAKLPMLMVYCYNSKRHYYDNDSLIIHQPKSGASTAENILHMLRPNCEYTEEEAKLLDLCLVVHAEHGGGNNSAFATHVVSSSGTDMYSAISTAIGSLKGPKHGGANIMVANMIEDIKANCNWEKEESVSAYLDKILDKETFNRTGLIYGMGHAIYTKSDPRAVLLKEKAEKMAKEKGFEDDFNLLSQIEKLTKIKMKERKGDSFEICANVDLYAGLVYEMLGINRQLYTPIFAVSRIAGWCAHRLEQIRDDKIMRPGYVSIRDLKDYTPMKKRIND